MIDVVTLLEFTGGKVWHIEDEGGKAFCGRTGPIHRNVIGVDYRVVRERGQNVCGQCRNKSKTSERREDMATNVKPDPKPGATTKKNGNGEKNGNGAKPKLSKAQLELREKIAKLKKKAAGIRWRINHASEKNVPAERVTKWNKELDAVNAEVAKLEKEKS